MAETTDRKTSISLSLPISIIEIIDHKRGKESRSSYVLNILSQSISKP